LVVFYVHKSISPSQENLSKLGAPQQEQNLIEQRTDDLPSVPRSSVDRRLRQLPKSFDREPPCQPSKFGRTLVELLHDGERFIE
jgi:hypothetical protein